MVHRWHLALAALLWLSSTGSGQTTQVEFGDIANVACLKQLSVCALDQLFQSAKADAVPVGLGRGTILCYADVPMPRLKAKSAGLLWKGKYFDCGGGIVNQWVGVRAIKSCTRVEASWCDGQPCVVIDYEAGTPVFGNARDELRCIGPGMYLGRFYERCPCPRFRGYFVLQFDCCK